MNQIMYDAEDWLLHRMGCTPSAVFWSLLTGVERDVQTISSRSNAVFQVLTPDEIPIHSEYAVDGLKFMVRSQKDGAKVVFSCTEKEIVVTTETETIKGLPILQDNGTRSILVPATGLLYTLPMFRRFILEDFFFSRI